MACNERRRAIISFSSLTTYYYAITVEKSRRTFTLPPTQSISKSGRTVCRHVLSNLDMECLCIFRRMADQHRAALKQVLVAWRQELADKLNLRCFHILPDSEVHRYTAPAR